MDNQTNELINELPKKRSDLDTNYSCNYNGACNCITETKTSDEEITIKLNLDTDETIETIDELKKKLNELVEDNSVIVFNNCIFQFGKHAMNTNYHKPIDNSCDCNCDCE